MQIRPFQLERYYAEHEFAVEYQLSSSDCETMSVAELLAMAGESEATMLDQRLGYTETRGAPALRAAIADWYPDLTPGDVLVCNAPEEGVFLAMHVLLEPGDTVVVQSPCYQSLAAVAESIGCAVRPWSAIRGEDGWSFDLAELERLVEDADVLVTNAPHNPTGWMPAPRDWEDIARLTRGRGVRWFSDEMYRGLERRPEESLTPAASIADHAVSLWGMSKTFGLAGLRIGWLASSDDTLLREAETLKDYTSICSSAPSELLATLALGVGHEIARMNRDRITANERLMASFAADHVALDWDPPDAGPVSLARLRTGTASEHARHVRTAGGALLVPSEVFGMDDGYLRIGTGRDDFPEALTRWSEALASIA